MEHIVQESAENSGSIENISFCYDLPLSVNQKERKSFTKQSSTVHYVRKHLVSQSVSDNFALHMSFFFSTSCTNLFVLSIFITCEYPDRILIDICPRLKAAVYQARSCEDI